MNNNTATGRIAKFNLEINANGVPEFMPELDANLDIIYYTPNGQPDRTYDAPTDGFKIKTMPHWAARVRYYNPELEDTATLQTVVIKLYNPLKGELQSLRPSIARLVRDSYIERLWVTMVNLKERI